MNKELNWNDLRFFTAVIRHGGMSGAARHLGVSIQTVGRRISALETLIGTSLFLRHSNGYIPTEEALALEAEAERVEVAIAQFRARSDRHANDMTGVVRLAAPETITTHLLLPALEPFLSQHPGLELELITGVSTVGIAKGEADIALRLVRPDQGALTRKRVGTLTYGLYTAVGGNTDLSTASLIGWTADYDLPAERWLKRLTGRSPNIRTTQLETQRAAIRAGLGVGILPCFLAEGLHRIPNKASMQETLWLVGHAESSAKRIKCVHNEIASIIEGSKGLLEG